MWLTGDIVKYKVTTSMISDRHASSPPGIRGRGLVYPRFFLVAICITLTAGSTWGAWLLLRIARARDFSAPSIFEINAHGQAQIYGWMGLFILGFALQMFPSFWGAQLAAPRLARALLLVMTLSILVRAVTEARPVGRWGELAIGAGALQLAVIAIFVAILSATARRSTSRWRVADRFLAAGLVWFLLAATLDLYHLVHTVGAPGRDALLAEIATWQLPLRDLQIHGLAVSMILGVSLRVLPGLFGTPMADESRAGRLFWPLQFAIVGEVVLFPLAMATRQPVFFLFYWIATVVFSIVTLVAVSNLRALLRPRYDLPRLSPLAFVRAAHIWLGVSLVMLVAGPFWSRALGLAFSHAWHGATRHAITVGFISLMMIGVASRIAPRPTGSGAAGAAMPVGPFVLLNLGCAVRVSQQVLTDLSPSAFLSAGVSGLLEVSGLASWAIWIVPRLARASRPLVTARAVMAEASGSVFEGR